MTRPLFVRKFHPHTAEIENVTGNTSPLHLQTAPALRETPQ